MISDGSADVREAVTAQMHDCVPLGWNPEPVDDGYVVLPPAWLGYVPAHRKLDGEEQKIIGVMHMLEHRGLVKETPERHGTWCALTMAAI